MGALLDLVIANTPNERNERNEITNRPPESREPAPGDLHQPVHADYELADVLGLEGSRQQFIGAVDLVAHFSGDRWPHDDALEALARWWGRDVETLTAIQWIVSAAYADEVQGKAKESKGT